MTHTPKPDEKKTHDDARADLLKRDLSNTENFDKSVLTYSSAGLALSLGFLKDFVPMQNAICPSFLYFSWAFFVLAIVTTMASFLISQLGIDEQIKRIHRYYIEGDISAINENNKYSDWTKYSAYAAGGTFLIALILTTVFVAININRETNMSNGNSLINKGASIHQIPKPNGGAAIPNIQPTTSTKPTPSPTPTPTPAKNNSVQ